MSFELNKDGAFVFYVNFHQEGDLVIERKCEAEQLFSFANLIESAEKYICSIERFRIPIQTIPMLPDINAAIILRSKVGDPDIVFNLEQTFSMYEFMLQINNAIGADFNLSLTADGRWKITDFDFGSKFIVFNNTIAGVFDMAITVGLLLIGVQNITGASVAWDRFDNLFKINIEALNGLSSVQPEVIQDQVYTSLITDFIIPSNTGLVNTNTENLPPNGQLTFNFQQREDLEFNSSSNRRFQMLRGASPIQNLKVRAVAIFRDNSRHDIILAPRSVFELKLSFWRK